MIPEIETVGIERMAEGENAGEPLFFVARAEKSASLSIVKRESGGEADIYGGGPIQKRETTTHNLPRREPNRGTHAE